MTKQEMIDKIGRRDIFSEESICALLEYPDKDEVIGELIKLIGTMQDDFYNQIDEMLNRVKAIEDRQSKIDFKITSTKKVVSDYIAEKEGETSNDK